MKCTIKDIRTLAMCDYAMRSEIATLGARVAAPNDGTPSAVALHHDYCVLLRDLTEAQREIQEQIRTC